MEFFLPSPITVTTFIFAFLLLILYYFLWMSGYKNGTGKRRIAPEAARGWPIIGHLRLFGGPRQPHIVLGAMAGKFGPIFTIRLGVHRALIVSSWEIVKECFTGTNDRVFSNRLKSVALEHMGYNYAFFGFSAYGPLWREMRKIVVLELLSNQQLAKLAHVRETEVMASVKEIHELWVKNESISCTDEVLVDMERWLQDMIFNLTVRIVAGKRCGDGKTDLAKDERCKKAVRESMELMGVFTVGDVLPFLRRLDLGGYEKAMKKTAKQLDSMLQEWLEEHKQRKNSGEAKEERDFMDVLLSILESGSHQISNFDADTLNKATCLGLTLASADTTTVTLTWALALLFNNKTALKKAQDELEIHVGKEKRVDESDLKNLVYIQAIIKETMRLYPPTQLLPPREAIEDCYVGGYYVPAGTRLIVNLGKLHQDPLCVAQPRRVSAREVSHHPQGRGCEGEAFWVDSVWEWKKIMPWNVFWASSYGVYACQFVARV